LHIGHIKACILNRALADKYNGKMLLRFDDTNPEKEDDEFEGSFQSDLSMLGVKWDGVVHTSDHFERIQQCAKQLIEQGDAFMDDTDQLTMREQRMALVPSKNRDASVETNLAHFAEMCSGSEEGQKWFLRAKIDYTSPNGAMRDPAIYRCINKAHHVTGEKYKAYPMYDLACPVVDSLDGVTHALRANEYADRKPQYEWFLEKLGMKKIEIFDFR
jgi:glutamyl-tRNA synthetase